MRCSALLSAASRGGKSRDPRADQALGSDDALHRGAEQMTCALVTDEWLEGIEVLIEEVVLFGG